MTERTETLTEASAPAIHHEGSYVDWSSILAGTVVASAIAFVFTTFGAALGLSLISPYDGDGSAVAALVAVGSWMMWTTISSFMAGAYIAGRLRRRVDHASADEVSIRDGIHGLAVWGAAILLSAFILGSAADTAVQATTETASAVATVVDKGTTVDDAQTASETAATTDATVAETKALAETARKYSVISAFVLAASLMVAGAGAYWAASMGGQHRDENRVFARFGRWT